MFFLGKKQKAINRVSKQIQNFWKLEKRFIPLYIKTSFGFDALGFINELINKIENRDRPLKEGFPEDRPLKEGFPEDRPLKVAWFYLSDKPQSTKTHFAVDNNFLYLNWQQPDLQVFNAFLQKNNSQKKSIVLVIDESHKNLTEEVFKQFFIPANPKIIMKISPEPFETQKDKRIFIKSISTQNPGCYLEIN